MQFTQKFIILLRKAEIDPRNKIFHYTKSHRSPVRNYLEFFPITPYYRAIYKKNSPLRGGDLVSWEVGADYTVILAQLIGSLNKALLLLHRHLTLRDVDELTRLCHEHDDELIVAITQAPSA